VGVARDMGLHGGAAEKISAAALGRAAANGHKGSTPRRLLTPSGARQEGRANPAPAKLSRGLLSTAK